MGHEQQNDGGVGLVGGEVFQSLFDERLPVMPGLQALFIKPHLVSALSQVVPQAKRQRHMRVTAVADENAHGFCCFCVRCHRVHSLFS